MNRRELFQLAVAALAAGKTALPAALVSAVADVPDWKPAFFNPGQTKDVMAITECIIPRTDTPGANDAKVYRYIDLLLEGGTDENRDEFTKGLAAVDKKAKAKYEVVFAQCSPEQQAMVLADLEGSSDKFFAQAKLFTVQIYSNTPQGYKELNRFGVPASYGCRT